MKKTIGVLALIVGIIAATGAMAFRGDYSVNGPDWSEDRHDAMEQAFDNLDYQAWKELMTETGRNPRVVDIVTEETFAVFVEAHEQGTAGNIEKASELRAQLGLGNGEGTGRNSGLRSGQRNGMRQNGRGFGSGNGDCLA